MNVELQSTLTTLDSSYRCRYPARYHPKSAEVMATVQDYFVKRWPWPSEKTKQLYVQTNLEEAMCLSFPTIPNDRVETVTACLGYMLLLDDIIEGLDAEKAITLLFLEVRLTAHPALQAERLGTHLSNIIMGTLEPDPNDQLGLLAAEICQQFRSGINEDDRQSGVFVLEETCRWIMDVGKVSKKQESVKDFHSFMEWRGVDVGYWFTASVFLWGCGITLPAHMKNDHDFRELIKISGLHVALANDLFSYRVEALRAAQGTSESHFMFNGVAVLTKEKQIDIQTAMNMIKLRLLEMEEEVDLLCGKLLESYADKERELISKIGLICKGMMAGNCEWSSFCFRYNGVKHTPVAPK